MSTASRKQEITSSVLMLPDVMVLTPILPIPKILQANDEFLK